MAKEIAPKHPGDVLKRARLQAEMSEKILTKRMGISKEDLSAIEEWRLDDLPDTAHLLPILKRITKELGVSYDKLAEGFPEAMKRTIPSRKSKRSNPEKATSIVLTSWIKYGLVGLLVLAMLGYAVLQSSSLGAKPPLTVFQPATNTVTEAESIEIRGETGEDIQVFINGTSAVVSESGDFSVQVVLQKGTNQIEIRAVNNVGAENVQTLVLVRQ